MTAMRMSSLAPGTCDQDLAVQLRAAAERAVFLMKLRRVRFFIERYALSMDVTGWKFIPILALGGCCARVDGIIFRGGANARKTARSSSITFHLNGSCSSPLRFTRRIFPTADFP